MDLLRPRLLGHPGNPFNKFFNYKSTNKERKFGNVASSIFAASVESFKKKSYYK